MSLQSTDPVADLLTRIRNAVAVGKTEIRVPVSKIKKVVAEQLARYGYVTKVTVEDGKPRGTLVITINETNTTSKIHHIKRISKPGRRVYVAANDIPRVKNGRGILLVSTSKGVLAGHEAKKQRLGGELLLEVY